MQTGSVPTFGVTGELHDGAAGLVTLRARWYTTRAGTFTAVDPFAGFAEQPYSQHPYQYAYSNPVRWTDPSGQCVPEGDGPDACDANFLGTLRAYLRNAQPFERRARAERGYLAANVVFDAYPDAARTYDPTTDPQLRRYIAARLWTTDVDATLATLDFALQQWRLDDARRMGQPVDVRPVVASAGILGVLTGGPEDFCYLSPGGGGGGGGGLKGTQNPETNWAAKTGRAYDRRVRAFWRQYEGQSIGGGWKVLSVNKRLAKKVQPDLVFINDDTQRIIVHDPTSKPTSSHIAKGDSYRAYFEAKYPGYRVDYTEGQWRGLEDFWEALDSQGNLYFPSNTKPR